MTGRASRIGSTMERVKRNGGFRVAVYRRDVGNLVRYGRNAPRSHQLLWIDPAECSYALKRPMPHRVSGQVLAGDWDVDVEPIEASNHVQFCIRHWIDGLTWEETGAYEAELANIRAHGGSYYGRTCLDDVRARYENLDGLFEEIRAARMLKTRAQLDPRHFRERGGILVHVGRDGGLIFNGAWGCHRIAIARVLDLGRIPVQVGVVHDDMAQTWRTSFV